MQNCLEKKAVVLTKSDLDVLHMLGDSLAEIHAISDRQTANELTDKQRLDLIASISNSIRRLPKAMVGGDSQLMDFITVDTAQDRTKPLRINV